MDSNLSRIRPKLRTSGNVTGNFGKPKVKAGSNLSGLGMTDIKVVTIPKREDYIRRLYLALDSTDNPKMKSFIIAEIKKELIRSGKWQQ
jgi:hypothetical protein